MSVKTTTLSVRDVRRLALATSGLLKLPWALLPRAASGRGRRARQVVQQHVNRMGYLQLDTVSVAGARSHVIVLMSRLEGFEPALGEELLTPQFPTYFEYWGHEACWLPMELYPCFGFRREAFQHHPWWGDVIGENRGLARDLVQRIRDEGPLRSLDLEGAGGGGWWQLKPAKKVATALWSSGELAIRERVNFQRVFDLTERVIDEPWLRATWSLRDSVKKLLLVAAQSHGWATTATLASTWRLRNMRPEIHAALHELVEEGKLQPCNMVAADGSRTRGWVRPDHCELVTAHLQRLRPRHDRGVLLSPFDPVLWDRARVQQLFGFDQILEIFKPAPQRRYGYYCMPVLAGEHLVARLDLKAERAAGRLLVRACHYEEGTGSAAREATRHALARYATALELEPVGL